MEIKIGDIVSFKDLWEGIVSDINGEVIVIEGNRGVFIKDYFKKKTDFTIEDLKRIYRLFNHKNKYVTIKNILSRFEQYKSDKWPLSVHRMILNALEGHPSELNHIYHHFLLSCQSKLGRELH